MDDEHPRVRRIVRPATIRAMVPLHQATIYRMEKRGEFPQRIKLGGNATGYYEDEVIEWQNNLVRGTYQRKYLKRQK